MVLVGERASGLACDTRSNTVSIIVGEEHELIQFALSGSAVKIFLNICQLFTRWLNWFFSSSTFTQLLWINCVGVELFKQFYCFWVNLQLINSNNNQTVVGEVHLIAQKLIKNLSETYQKGKEQVKKYVPFKEIRTNGCGQTRFGSSHQIDARGCDTIITNICNDWNPRPSQNCANR